MHIKNTTDRDETIRGVNFKSGSVVPVADEGLARKVLGLDGFIVAPKKAKKNASNKA